MSKLLNTIYAAVDSLHKEHPRASYAADVILGYQAWSGADLKGKARKYSMSYHCQRARAGSFFRSCGGLILPVDNGKLVSAVYIGQDDYGNAIYDTLQGIAVMHKKFCKLV